MSNLELGTRVPLIFRAPWLKGMGTVSGALAELVDMYPTLSELAGLTLPTGDAGAYLGGTSLVPVLAGTAKQVKNCTISQFPRCYQNNSHHSGGKPGDESNRTVSWESMSDCHWVDRGSIDFMGCEFFSPSTLPFALVADHFCPTERRQDAHGGLVGHGVVNLGRQGAAPDLGLALWRKRC